jgi:serine/threonine protein kinase
MPSQFEEKQDIKIAAQAIRVVCGEDIEPPVLKDFEILSTVGSGGMGSVYKARQISTDKTFAIKVLHPELARDPVNIRRFEQEAEACSKLDNPHIVNVYQVGTTSNGLPFLVMDYIAGTGLDELIREDGFIEQARAIDIFLQVCDALRAAHEAGLVHRDVKPSNIMLVRSEGATDFAKVLDFGIARTLQQVAKDGHRVTQTGDLLGSPVYMSPEQCLGQKLDARSDIYSLAIVMYEALTGKIPFEAPNAVQTLLKQINDEPKAPRSVRPDFNISERLEHLILKGLAKDPNDRWQSIDEVSAELKAIAANEPMVAAPLAKKAKASGVPRTFSKSERFAIFGVAAFGIFIGLFFHQGHQEHWKRPASYDARFAVVPLEDYAFLELRKKHYEQGVKAWEKALQLAEGSGLPAKTVAELYQRAGDEIISDITVGKAEPAGRRIDYSYSEMPSEPRLAATIKFWNKAFSFAQEAKDRVLETEVAQKLANIEKRVHNSAEQERWLREYLRVANIAPRLVLANRFDAELQLGQLLADQGRRDEAEKLLRDSVQYERENGFYSYPGPINSLANMYMQQRRFKDLDALYQSFYDRRGQINSGSNPDMKNWIESLRERGLNAKADEVQKSEDAAKERYRKVFDR